MLFVLCRVGSNFQRKPSQHRRDKFLLHDVFFFGIPSLGFLDHWGFCIVKNKKNVHSDNFYDEFEIPKTSSFEVEEVLWLFFPSLNNVFVGET